tara:strand:- start:54702 stop:55121 length:420 start_codon:yes stop_codon:yes gene_type:complete
MYSINIDPITILQALSDRTRLRILRVLLKNPKEEACLCEFSDSLQEPEYNVSRHLKILRQSGLLSAQKDGRWVYHRLINDVRLKPYYRLVEDLQGFEQIFKEDEKRFREETEKRTGSRCKKEGPSFVQSEKKVKGRGMG